MNKAVIVLMTMLAGGLLLVGSGSSIAQQQGTVATAQPASCPGPPLETYVHSTSEDGQQGFAIVYHADGTLDMAYNIRDGQYEARSPVHIFTGGGKNHGRWALTGCKFCFVLDKGPTAGKKICKNGRLIGRVSTTGMPLPPQNAPAHP